MRYLLKFYEILDLKDTFVNFVILRLIKSANALYNPINIF